MIVYIEQVIVDNMIINYFLLWFCSAVLKEKTSFARFLTASGVGTLFAILFSLFSLNIFLLFFLKILLCLLIVLVAFKYKDIKNFLAICVCFLVSTFLLGGAVIGFVTTFFDSYSIENGTFAYKSKVPIGVFVFCGFLFFKLAFDVFKLSKNKLEIEKMMIDISVQYLNKTTKIKAFLDTGNLLVDKKTSLPIIVINFKAFRRITNIKTEDFLLGNYNVLSQRYHKFDTANKTSKMLVFEVDNISFKQGKQTKIIKSAVLGLALNNFSKKLNCEALIGLNLIEMGEVYD